MWARNPLRWVPNPILTPGVSPPRAGPAAHPAETQTTDRTAGSREERFTPGRPARMAARFALLQGWRRTPSSHATATGDAAYRAAALSRHQSRRRVAHIKKPGQDRRASEHMMIGLNCQSLSATGAHIFGLGGDRFHAILGVAAKAGAVAVCLQGTRWRGSEYIQHKAWHVFHSPVKDEATGPDAHTGVMIAIAKQWCPMKPRYAQAWERGDLWLSASKHAKGKTPHWWQDTRQESNFQSTLGAISGTP